MYCIIYNVQISGGPPVHSMYITALYFTMTCMTSIGFGNVAADSDSEKVMISKQKFGVFGIPIHSFKTEPQ